MKPSGVVLMGGKSARMGQDKAFLTYHQKPLFLHMAELIQPFCDVVYLSVNAYQSQYHFDLPTIIDQYADEGPIGGLLSCYNQINDSILLVGCDLPLLDSLTIQNLMSSHQGEGACTMYYNLSKNCYEPMLAHWHRAMMGKLSDYFRNGGRSWQLFLNTHEVKKNYIPNVDVFTNVNFPQDWDVYTNLR